MSVRFTMDSEDNYLCGNAYDDGGYKNVSHPIVVRPEYIITNDHPTYPDSNYNSGSECSSINLRVAGVGAAQRASGWKIFGAIVLQAWRRRRKESKELVDTLEQLKMESACSKSQLHVYSALIEVEQKRNEELTSQLKKTLSNLNRAKSSCENMSTTLKSFKAIKTLLEQELKIKYQEYDDLHSVLAQTKTDLFRSMMDNRNLQSQLSNEQRAVQSLENQKNQLINEIYDLNAKTGQIEDTYMRQFEEKQQQLDEMRDKLKVVQARFDELNEKLNAMRTNQNEENKMANKMIQLSSEVSCLQNELEDSLSNRLRIFWNQIQKCHTSTIRYVHIWAYYLLPAMPPPRSQFWPKVKKG